MKLLSTNFVMIVLMLFFLNLIKDIGPKLHDLADKIIDQKSPYASCSKLHDIATVEEVLERQRLDILMVLPEKERRKIVIQASKSSFLKCSNRYVIQISYLDKKMREIISNNFDDKIDGIYWEAPRNPGDSIAVAIYKPLKPVIARIKSINNSETRDAGNKANYSIASIDINNSNNQLMCRQTNKYINKSITARFP